MPLVSTCVDVWRLLACWVWVCCGHVSELIPLADDMCKCPRVSVVREVDAFGEARKRRQRVVVTVTSEDVLWMWMLSVPRAS